MLWIFSDLHTNTTALKGDDYSTTKPQISDFTKGITSILNISFGTVIDLLTNLQITSLNGHLKN